jgi:hypothetical protein
MVVLQNEPIPVSGQLSQLNERRPEAFNPIVSAEPVIFANRIPQPSTYAIRVFFHTTLGARFGIGPSARPDQTLQNEPIPKNEHSPPRSSSPAN